MVRKRRRERHKEFLTNLLAIGSCSRCGIGDSRVLIFHHRDSGTKNQAVSQVTNYGEKKFMEEINKCDILCWNCHMLVHWEMRKEGEK